MDDISLLCYCIDFFMSTTIASLLSFDWAPPTDYYFFTLLVGQQQETPPMKQLFGKEQRKGGGIWHFVIGRLRVQGGGSAD